MSVVSDVAASRTTLNDIAIQASDDLALRMHLRRNPESVVKSFDMDPDVKKALITRRASEIRAVLHQAEGRGLSSMLTIMICIVDTV